MPPRGFYPVRSSPTAVPCSPGFAASEASNERLDNLVEPQRRLLRYKFRWEAMSDAQTPSGTKTIYIQIEPVGTVQFRTAPSTTLKLDDVETGVPEQGCSTLNT
jgi:hypothetical protein